MPPKSTPDDARRTLVDLLRERAQRAPEQRGFTFLLDGETTEAHLSYAGLDERARAIGAALLSLGAGGQRVLLLYPPGLDYLAGFFGCLYAGAVAVPIYPPDAGRLSRTLPRLLAVCADAQAAFALTTGPILAMAELLFDQAPELRLLRWLATDALDPAEAAAWRDPGARGGTLAFLQYTSGSTAAPRGVMLTHDNLLHNLGLICRAFGASEATRGVIWLPPYHDMGLIGGILQPLYLGCFNVLMSPIDFLKRPARWLEAISRYRGTTSGGPNFAYDLCARRVTPEERARLDLSTWELAFNGAEPIRAETLRRFTEAFAPCGFRPEAFYPCYGLAEATLIVTGGHRSTPPVVRAVDAGALRLGRAEAAPPEHAATAVAASTLVSSGRALEDGGQRVVVVDPQTGTPCAPDRVGEIWVAGPSVAEGYWHRPEDTARAFHAALAGYAGDGRFLRTGDLGFFHDGELFVTGRIKDLILLRGRNHYPQDIEHTAERSHPALRPGCGAAFSIEVDGEERLVVVHEVDRRVADGDAGPSALGDIARAVREAISSEHDVQAYAVVLLRSGTIPKTSSGKIQRHACRTGFLSDGLELLHKSVLDAPTPDEATPAAPRPEEASSHERADGADARAPGAGLLLDLQALCARVLRVPRSQLDPGRSLYAFGLDSLTAIELKSELEAAFQVEVPLTAILQGATLNELSAAILAGREAPRAPREALVPPALDATGDAPLSFGQQSLWFMHQLAPASAAYHVPILVRVRAALDVAALRRALETLVARHPALRTTFEVTPSGPVQRVRAHGDLDLAAEDAASLSDEALDRRLREEVGRPFDLERGPLLRVRVLTRAPDEHALLLVMHHIITDFWSISVLAEELSVLYPAACAGRDAVLPPPQGTPADHARAQAELLSGPRGAALAAYWKAALSGDLPVLDLPTDHPRPPVQRYRGRLHTTRLGAPLTEALKALAERRGVTLNTVLLAAFQALLHRLTGQPDFAIGIASAGRGRAEQSRVVGYFVNPLVLRARPTPAQTFASFLDTTRTALLGAFEHEEYPFTALVDLLQPARDPSRSPLFQVMFVHQRAYRLHDRGMTPFALSIAGAKAELAGLPIESMVLDQGVAQLDLTLTTGEAQGELVASFEYNTDLFEPDTIARMAQELEVLLSAVVRDPEQRLGALPILPESERQTLLACSRGARVALPEEGHLPALFAAQAKRTPDNLAVVFREERLSYRELAQRAERLAAHLRARGLGRGAMVGLFLERSIETIVAVLGVLRAGGAYVPIEPTCPRERLARVLADARVEIVLTQARQRAHLADLPRTPGAAEVQIACLDEPLAEGVAARDGADEGTPIPLTPRDLACVIYTSGSSGEPKGVMLEHAGLLNLVGSFLDSYRPDARDRIVPLTSVASASFVGEILPILCAGGTLVLPDEDEILDTERLVDLIARSAVTIVSTVPAVLAGLNARRGEMPPIRLVLSGGEALSAGDVAGLVETTTVVNGYGLTETTVCSTFHRLRAEDRDARGWVPIGRPIINTEVYVLDEALHCAPIGCPGELYVGGLGVARGYLGRPGLTAERFLPDPFRPGERMYRTGDKARWLPSGVLEYLHRADDQVKIRGYRVELGEIEAALKQHQGVRDACAVIRDNPRGLPGDGRLVAYVVPAGDALSTSDLHAWLAERLPPPMLPSAFVTLASLPLSPNGKVDTKSLPAPSADRPSLAAAYAPPQSAIEREIAAIWQDVLQLASVGTHDNFFELGGNSLLIARVHRRLREELGADLALVEMFRYSTVSALAQRLGQRSGAPDAAQKIRDEGQRRRAALTQRKQVAQSRPRAAGPAEAARDKAAEKKGHA